MRTTHSSVAVFLWTFRRKWKGYVVFLAATAALIFLIVGIYPEFSDLQSQRMAEALGGDLEISLAEDKDAQGNYTLSWSKYGGVDGYAVVESNAQIPMIPAALWGQEPVDLQSIQMLLRIGGTLTLHLFDPSVTQTHLTGLDAQYGADDAAVYFVVLAFSGPAAAARICGTSHTVNTRDMQAKGAYDKLMKNPIIQAFIGDSVIDIYSVKGFLCMEVLSSLTLYVIVYFIIQYAGAFCLEMETKTIDLLLSTPLRRRHLFISRYLSWFVLDLILIAGWILFITIAVRAIGKGAQVPLTDVARTLVLFIPFMLCVQGFCMLVSVLTNESRKAYGICFGIYYGMCVLVFVGGISKKLFFVKYATLFYYWESDLIFIEGVISWWKILMLSLTAVVLFVAGLLAFERKDLAA